MEVKIKKPHPYAVMPYKTYEDDFCCDCVATSCEEVAPNVYKYGIGLAFQIDRDKGEPFIHGTEWNNYIKKSVDAGFVPLHLSIDFRPRSSVWKTGMVLSGCEGAIDELYRGEVSAVFYHIMSDMPRYKVGDGIGQIKLGFTLPMNFTEVEELDKTERNDGAYGSTGK